jgi:hypothetical protein
MDLHEHGKASCGSMKFDKFLGNVNVLLHSEGGLCFLELDQGQ